MKQKNSAEIKRKPLKKVNSKNVSRSAFKVSLGSLLGLFVGLGTQMLTASIFGAGFEMDAYLTALVVPIYFQAVLLSGLSFVFVPAFVESQMSGHEEDAWALVGTFFWLISGILTVIAVTILLQAPQIILLSAPGLNAEKSQLAASMLAILILAIPFDGLSSLTIGIQNARDRFFWPAMGAAVGSFGNLIILWLLYPMVGAMILAWGYLASSIIRACVTTIPVVRHGWTRLIPLTDARVKEMAGLIWPFIFFGLLTRAAPVLERFFASGLPDGELSYLGYAAKVSRIFNSLLGAAVSTAIFPVMSKAYSQNGYNGLKRTMKYGLRLALAMGLPIVLIFSALAIPFVTVLFERGAFEHLATLQVSRIVPIVMVSGVLFPMVGSLVSRAFYVTKDTRTVPIVAAVVFIVYAVAANFMVQWWGYVGLAGAQLIYKGASIAVLIFLLLRRFQSFTAHNLFRSLALYGVASMIAFVIALTLVRLFASLPVLLTLIVTGITAGLAYFLLLFWIDSQIAQDVLEMTGLKQGLKMLKANIFRTTKEALN